MRVRRVVGGPDRAGTVCVVDLPGRGVSSGQQAGVQPGGLVMGCPRGSKVGRRCG